MREWISLASLFRHCPLRSMSYAFQIKCIEFRGLHLVGQTIKSKQTDMETHDALFTLLDEGSSPLSLSPFSFFFFFLLVVFGRALQLNSMV